MRFNHIVWFGCVLVLLFLSGCKIIVTVNEGGKVVTDSGRIAPCVAGTSCTIDVSDENFDEVFRAVPNKGYVFQGWEKPNLCGGSAAPCKLFTTGFEAYPAIVALLNDPDFETHLIPRFLLDTDGDSVPDEDDGCPNDASGMFDADANGVCDETESTPYVQWIKISEAAMSTNEVRTKEVLVEFQTTGEADEWGVEVNRSLGAQANGPFVASDTGENGDRIAGDGIYSFHGLLVKSTPTPGYHNSKTDIITLRVVPARRNEAVRIESSAAYSKTFADISIISASEVVPAKKIANGLYANDYVVGAVMPKFKGKYDIPDLTRKLCRQFGNKIDFISIIDRVSPQHKNKNKEYFASNNVPGIGIAIFDQSGFYGCNGLQYITYNTTDFLGQHYGQQLLGRYASHLFDSSLNLSLALINDPANPGQVTTGSFRGFWGLSDFRSPLGIQAVHTLRRQSNGTFIVDLDNGGAHSFARRAVDLTQYLWGCKAPQTVLDHPFLLSEGMRVPSDFVFSSGDVTSVSTDDIIEAYGEREQMPKQTYNVLRVVVVPETPSDALLSVEAIQAEHHGGIVAPAQGQTLTIPSIEWTLNGCVDIVTKLSEISGN